eukprot:403340314
MEKMAIENSIKTHKRNSSSKYSDISIDTQDDDNGKSSQYKQELHRGLNSFMSFSISFTNVACISSLAMMIDFGLVTGGPVIMLYGWITVSIFTMIVASSMAEICSTYPVAGSVYYWAGALASPEWAPVASYLCGWFNFFGNIANNASFSFGLSKVLAGLVVLFNEGRYVWSIQTQVFVSIIILAMWGIKNRMRIDNQGWFNNTSALYQLISTIFVVFVIFLVSPKLSSSEFVFTKFNNDTGFSNVYFVSVLGLLMSMYGFSGYEGGAHLAEETTNANVSAPQGIIYSCLLSVFTGVIFILAVLYGCQENIHAIVQGNSDHAAVNLFEMVFSGNKNLSLIMTMILMLNIFLAGFSNLTVTSRIGFAMARDGAFPYSDQLKKINKDTKSPDMMILLIFILASCLCLLPLISSTAFEAITSIATIGVQLSYAIPIFFRVTQSRDTFKRNHYNLGSWSTMYGWISVIWLSFTSCCLLLPSKRHPTDGITAENFNYSPIVVCLFLVFAAIYWNLPEPFGAKYFFKGPKRVISQEDNEESYRTFDQQRLKEVKHKKNYSDIV